MFYFQNSSTASTGGRDRVVVLHAVMLGKAAVVVILRVLLLEDAAQSPVEKLSDIPVT